MEIGTLILTAEGRKALADANKNGDSIKPKTFRVSAQNIDINNLEITADSITWWISKDITTYSKIDNDTVEFTTIVEPNEATDYMQIIGLFLEDGTMIALGKQPYGGLVPATRQIGRPRLRYVDASNGLLDFKYIPSDKNETRIKNLEEINNKQQVSIDSSNTSYITTLKTSSTNATQGVCVDRKTNELFSVQLTGGKVRLSRFSSLKTNGFSSATWSVDLDLPHAHQSLAIVYYDNQRWFVMNGDASGYITLFRADSSGLLEQRDVKTHNNVVGNFCTAGNNPSMTHLVVEGLEKQDIQTIKVFSLDDVFEWNDISGRALFQYDIEYLDSPPYPLQSLVIDENFNTYIAYGGGDKNYDNFIRVYDKQGSLVQQETITAGIDDTDKYEQEGIFWFYPNGVPTVAINVLTGADGHNISKVFAFTKDINTPFEKWIDVANPPQDYMYSGSKVLGISDGLSLDRLYLSFHRLSKNIAQFNVRVEVSGFTADLPNDATTYVLIDFNTINRDYGLFQGIKGGSYGACTIEYKGDDFDVTPTAGVVLIQNKDDNTKPNTVGFYTNDYQIQDGNGINKMIATAQVTIRVL